MIVARSFGPTALALARNASGASERSASPRWIIHWNPRSEGPPGGAGSIRSVNARWGRLGAMLRTLSSCPALDTTTPLASEFSRMNRHWGAVRVG